MKSIKSHLMRNMLTYFILASIAFNLTQQQPLLADNTCFQCLKTSNQKFCTDGSTQKCCPQLDATSQLCNRPDCVFSYQSPSSLPSNNNYTQTHPRQSEYDYYLNLYQCQGIQKNPCTSLDSLIVPSIGYFRSNLLDQEKAEYCFYNNTLSKQATQTLQLQVKLTNNSEDYQAYVWYSYQSQTPMQSIDGFNLANTMIMYVVVFKNTTIKVTSSKYSHATLQISLFDNWIVQSDTGNQEAPILVIVIAVIVGGLICAFCIGAVVWMILKAVKKNKEQQANQSNQQSLQGDIGDEDETVQRANIRRQKTLEQIRKNNDIKSLAPDLISKQDIERHERNHQGLDGIDSLIQNKDTIKVLPDRVIIQRPQSRDRQTANHNKRFNHKSGSQLYGPEEQLEEYKRAKSKMQVLDEIQEIEVNYQQQKQQQRPGTAQVKVKRNLNNPSVTSLQSDGIPSKKSTAGGYLSNSDYHNQNNIPNEDTPGQLASQLNERMKNVSNNLQNQMNNRNHYNQQQIINEDDEEEIQDKQGDDFVAVDLEGLENDDVYQDNPYDNQNLHIVNNDASHFRRSQQQIAMQRPKTQQTQNQNRKHNILSQSLQNDSYAPSPDMSSSQQYHNEDLEHSTKKGLLHEPSFNKFMITGNENNQLAPPDDDDSDNDLRSSQNQIIHKEQQQQKNHKNQKTIQEVDDEDDNDAQSDVKSMQQPQTRNGNDDKPLQNVFYQGNNDDDKQSQDYGYESIEEIQ
eukprot:403332653